MKTLALFVSLFVLAGCGDDAGPAPDPSAIIVSPPQPPAPQTGWFCRVSTPYVCTCGGPGDITPEINAWTDMECARLRDAALDGGA